MNIPPKALAQSLVDHLTEILAGIRATGGRPDVVVVGTDLWDELTGEPATAADPATTSSLNALVVLDNHPQLSVADRYTVAVSTPTGAVTVAGWWAYGLDPEDLVRYQELRAAGTRTADAWYFSQHPEIWLSIRSSGHQLPARAGLAP